MNIEIKIKSYIGFAIRMNKTVFGTEAIKVGRKKPYLVVYDETLGNSNLKKILAYCEHNQIKTVKIEGLLSEMTARDNAKVVGIYDSSLANAIISVTEVQQ